MARFTSRQVALGQFNLLFGSTVETIEALVERRYEKAAEDDLKNKTLRSPRVFQIAGPCDVLVELEPRSFRRLPEAAKLLIPESLSTQWTLGKQVYVDAGLKTELARPSGQRDDPLDFIFFLRMHREVYRRGGAGADHHLIEGIEKSLRGHATGARILAGLGWADYVVTGQATAGRRGVFSVLVGLLELRCDGIDALQRSITLVGYEWTSEVPPPHGGRVPGYGLKIRLKPTAVVAEHKQLRSFLESLIVGDHKETDYLLSYTGGKRDLIFVPRAPLRMRNLLLETSLHDEWHRLAKGQVGVEHVETNLVLSPTVLDFGTLEPRGSDDLAKSSVSSQGREDRGSAHVDGKAVEAAGESRADQKPGGGETAEAGSPPTSKCSFCSQVKLKVDLERGELRKRIPTGIWQSLQGIYALFRAVLNDPYKCCDLSTAIRSCDGILSEVLEELEKLWSDTPSGPSEDGVELDRAARFQWLARYYDSLKVWCSRTEKVINERSVGSFANKLVPQTAVGPYRGHVNKILLTADHLVREFVGRVSRGLGLPNSHMRVEPPTFHLGATDQIVSDLRAGVVTLPNRYMFTLALATPQLWSESGVRVFNRIYQPPFRKILAERIQLFLLENGRYQPPGEDPELHYQVNLLGQSKRDVLAEVADHYADLLVACFGLESEFTFGWYLVSLYTSAFNQRTESGLPEDLRRTHNLELLQRLLMVYETCLILRTAPGNPLFTSREKLADFTSIQETYWGEQEIETPRRVSERLTRGREKISDVDREARARVLENCTEKIDQLFGEGKDLPGAKSKQESWPWPVFDQQIKDLALERMLSDAYYCCHWNFMWDFITRIAVRGPIDSVDRDGAEFTSLVRRIQSGEVVDLRGARYLNDFFAEGHALEASIRYSGQQMLPAGMAALGRSVMLAFHARQEDH